MNTQLKIKLLIVSAFLLIIFLFSGFVYLSISNYSHTDFFHLLKIRAVTNAKIELDGKHDAMAQSIAELRSDYFDHLPQEKDFYFALKEVDAAVISNELEVPQSFIQEAIAQGEAVYKSGNIYFMGLTYSSAQGPYLVIVSAENYYNSHHFSYLRKVLLLAIAIVIVFALLLSNFISKSVFKPINEITHSVNEISTENLHLRLASKNNNDELGDLVNTFNNMLDRIETSFETQKNFISNASHELRTPLTAIIGEADVTLSKPRTTQQYEETIRVILQEAEKLDKKTQALLFLAQTGYTDKVQKFERLRIDQLLWDVKDTIQKLYPESKVHFDLSMLPEDPTKLKIMGNAQLLHLAFSNVISNGCKYSNNQPVKVAIGAGDKKVIIVVKDEGIGIPENELAYIYDPFFRASNSYNYEGYGIGLPLTRNIIRMHKGHLTVTSSENQGTTVEIKLPSLDQPNSF
jgi:signal transduction histidine kinase